MNARVLSLLKHPVTIPAGVGVLSFAGGFGLGYLLGKRKTTVVNVTNITDQLEFDFDVEGMAREAEAERQTHIITEKAYYSPAVVPEVEEDDVAMASDTDAVVEENVSSIANPAIGVTVVDPEDQEPELIEVNVFEEQDEDWDWETEVALRRELTPGEPYLLHRDEFFRDEMNFAQMSLRYFEGDDQMVDEDDDPVHNWPAICGKLDFGHGATDPNVCYVRNEDRRAEYEVTREEGSYSQEILGIHIEDNARVQDLRHSHRPGKFRMD